MTAVPFATARITSGTAGADHVLTSSRGTSFVAGQPLWLSVFVQATRTTGVATTTLRRALKWYNAAGGLISTTFDDTVIDATIPLTFLEAQHTAPALSTQVEEVFTLTPASPPIQHTVDLSRPRLGRTQVAADVTAAVSPATATRSFSHTYTGVADTGQFPRGVSFTLNNALGQITSGIAWTYNVVTGTVNTFTSASGTKAMTGTGAGTITIDSLGTNSAEVKITSTYNGVARTATLYLDKTFAAAPTGGGGGGGGGEAALFTSSVNTTVDGSTFGDATGTKTAVMPTGKTTARLTMNLDVGCSDALGNPNEFTMEAKFQRNISGTWTDQGVTQTAYASYDNDPEAGITDAHGSVVYSFDVTGLTAGVSYDWRVVVRENPLTNSTGNLTGTFTGVAP